MECIVKCCTDRVGLYHISHKSQGQDDSYRKETCQEFSKSALEYVFYIIYRASYIMSVFQFSCMLCHNSFRIDGSHSEECTDPHPEDGTRSSGCNRCCCSGDITGSYLGGNRCCQSLKRTETIFSFPAMQRKITKQCFHSGTKLSYLNKFQAERVNDTGSQKQDQQCIIPQKRIDTLNYFCNKFHVFSSPSLFLTFQANTKECAGAYPCRAFFIHLKPVQRFRQKRSRGNPRDLILP